MRIGKWLGAGLLVLIGAVLVMGKLAGFGCAGPALPPLSAQAEQADLMEGDWVGRWASSQSDMSGKLSCQVRRQADGTYLARFDAVFAKILTNTSVVTLTVGRKGPAWEFTGEKDLGLLKGGVYKYAGRSDGQEFVCDYDSKHDKGTFRMKRVAAATQPARQ